MSSRPDVGNVALPRNEFEALHAFQGEMWRKLIKNAHKGGWSDADPFELLGRAEDELNELREALNRWNMEVTLGSNQGQIAVTAEKVAKEAADVGNFVMMVADVVGGLKYERRR